jgi:MFS family permease
MPEQEEPKTAQTKEETKAAKKQKKEAKRLQSEAKELARLEKEKARPKKKTYFWYLVVVLCLIYIVDEVSTSLHNGMVNEIVLDFFGQANVSSGLSKFSLMEMLANIFLVIGFFYKSLADRFGRKPFLIANTLGMAGGLLLCFWSSNLAVYIIGFCVIRFFVTPDEQIVYIMEEAPKEKRATVFNIVKGIAELGLILIPIGRRYLMKDVASEWRIVFLIPAILGAVAALTVCFLARETDAFLDERIAYLKLTPEEREAIALEKKDQSKKQGGFFNAIKYVWGNKQLRWICLCTMFYTLSRCITSEYNPILKAPIMAGVSETDTTAYTAAQNLATSVVTNSMFTFPLSCALVIVVYGFLSDKMGRKVASTSLLGIALISLALLVIGANLQWDGYILGIFVGLFLGADWNNSDTLILMCGESAPTNLRASVLSAQTLFYGAGMIVSQGMATIVLKLIPDTSIGYFALGVAAPCFILSSVFLWLKVKETKGASLEEGAPAQ